MGHIPVFFAQKVDASISSGMGIGGQVDANATDGCLGVLAAESFVG